MLKSLTFVAVAALSFTSQASVNRFVNADSSIETQICVTAAEQGFTAARKSAAQHGITLSRFSSSLLCNGEDIRELAKRADVNASNKAQASVKLYAKNESKDTELCLKAAQKGVKALGHKARNLRCNSVPVRQFVKEIADAAI